ILSAMLREFVTPGGQLSIAKQSRILSNVRSVSAPPVDREVCQSAAWRSRCSSVAKLVDLDAPQSRHQSIVMPVSRTDSQRVAPSPARLIARSPLLSSPRQPSELSVP